MIPLKERQQRYEQSCIDRRSGLITYLERLYRTEDQEVKLKSLRGIQTWAKREYGTLYGKNK